MDATDGSAALKGALKSQFHAGLSMLRTAIERCPQDLWLRHPPRNAFWQVAYHDVFYTHFYLHTDHTSFRPWVGHREGVQHPDGIGGKADPGSKLPLIPEPYTRAQTLEYLSVTDDLVDSAIDAMDIARPDSGFPWYRMTKLEHQLVNLRHLQHHAAQLADRLRAQTDQGVGWVGSGR